MHTRQHRRTSRFATVSTAVACLVMLTGTPVASADEGSPAGAVRTAQAAADTAALMKKGKDLYRSKKYAAAAETFRKVLAVDDSVVNAHRGLGRALEKLDRYEEAAAAYEAMREAVPDEPEALYRLGIVYRKLNRPMDSVRAYRDYSAQVPDDPDPYYGLGESLRDLGDKKGAIAAYEDYIEKETRPSEQKYVKRAKKHVENLRAALAKAEMEARAKEAGTTTAEDDESAADAPDATLPEKEAHVPTPDAGAEEVLPAEPDSVVDAAAVNPAADVDAAIDAGDAAFAEDTYGYAAERYLAAHLGAPNRVEPAYKLGVALAASGDLPGAIDAWEAALDLAPDFEPAKRHIQRAQIRLAAEATLDAEALTGEADARRKLARAYLDEGRYLMALRAAEALREIAPEDPMTHRLTARAHLGLADPAAALEALEDELAIEPADFELYRLLGTAHEQLGNADEARYYYELYLATVDPGGTDESLDEFRARLDQLSADET